MAIAVLTDVVKRYENKLTVDHVNVTIQAGEIFGLLGPNGAGKSTTISMICGLLKIDSGDIVIDGLSVSSYALEVKKKIGLVPQDLALYNTMTAAENVTFFGRLYGLRGKLLKERVAEALAFTGLSDRAKEKPATFSGGMKRRLNIACAIMHHPKLIIMDEPTVGIDPQSRNHILESVKELNRLGSTVIYTSHYMEEVAAICDRVAIMDKGHIIACGTEKELRERVSQEEKIVVKATNITPELINELSLHPRITRVESKEGTVEMYLPSSQDELQDILFIFAKHEGVIGSLNIEEPDLETLFLSLTGRTLRD
ncbi:MULTISPECIES: ABC transporter ATP-binding protein [Paenibacillus]|uniref:ABC transporter ATP-binding protein n=1 Tax=Paenibacillus odorifer TaxID=189426 RepID=A0A1R0WX31_9BACL|nr:MULTISPECIES: ABC transporter ATP-binding protein [Paenibacillus]AWV36072.1 ABC transporter ATP-binding protein [Paenibacillus odorifer]ETT65551.1 ABC transporter-like protein [Paenibacillus sp. FSL H8-237]MDH6428649.1 ABC-2 type transport system ATP-binding protein [Paenibacillus sp. PastH-4]MDH6444850.1 ABC-2 type transport system ATP-binding protein [Paenibacillus sp. PastF-4]MDH6528744.1 ABC-2 type transport system ATP-binding protein [Paenibacillus sp. PastH-3]